MGYIVSNDGSPGDEAVLGDMDIFDSVAAAERYFEHWISEERGVRFYDARGERWVAIDHGDLTFHLEKTGTVFEGFDNLIRREAERSGIDLPETGFSVEYVLRAIWERNEKFKQENQGCLAWFLPPKHFKETYGFWSWYFPSLRKEPPGS